MVPGRNRLNILPAGRRKLKNTKSGVLFLKTEQAICPPYAQKSESNNNHRNKNVNKRKKSETLITVARLLIKDFTLERKEIASICGVSTEDVSYVMKKMEKTLSQGHIILGLSNVENEELRLKMDLRSRNESNEKDAFLRTVAKVIIEYHRLAGSQIAARINESSMNVSRAIHKIKKRVEMGNKISGLTAEEHDLLKTRLGQRVNEAALEKEQKAREREMAKEFREERKNKTTSAKTYKKPATISATGMAEWNRMHYDPVTGALKMPRTSIPEGMPRRYPKKQIAVSLSTPESYRIPGVPPKAAGSSTGRRRIGIMQLS